MSFAVFTPKKEAEQCYEWRPINMSAWDRSVLLHSPRRYVSRMFKRGKYYAGYCSRAYGECYAGMGSGYFINAEGYPAESIWINEGCTVYAQKYALGEEIPQRAVIVGTWSNGIAVVVASVANKPGYYVEGAAQAVGPFEQSTEFTILVVL